MTTLTTEHIGWEISHKNNGIHVIPLVDLKPHSEINCECQPVNDESIFVHNSFDGREAFERMDRKLS